MIKIQEITDQRISKTDKKSVLTLSANCQYMTVFNYSSILGDTDQFSKQPNV